MENTLEKIQNHIKKVATFTYKLNYLEVLIYYNFDKYIKVSYVKGIKQGCSKHSKVIPMYLCY